MPANVWPGEVTAGFVLAETETEAEAGGSVALPVFDFAAVVLAAVLGSGVVLGEAVLAAGLWELFGAVGIADGRRVNPPVRFGGSSDVVPGTG